VVCGGDEVWSCGKPKVQNRVRREAVKGRRAKAALIGDNKWILKISPKKPTCYSINILVHSVILGLDRRLIKAKIKTKDQTVVTGLVQIGLRCGPDQDWILNRPNRPQRSDSQVEVQSLQIGDRSKDFYLSIYNKY